MITPITLNHVTSLTVVIPCYNEAQAIPGVLRRLKAFLETLPHSAITQVIIVDDASSDATTEILCDYPWVESLRLERRSGYGAALKAGFLRAHGEAIAFLDMDETYDPADLKQLVEVVLTGRAKIAMGDRLENGEGMPTVRVLGNRFFSRLVQWLSGYQVRDVCTGCRVFHRTLLAEICALPAEGLQFSLSITLWSLRSRLSVVELPITYRHRTGRSKLRVLTDGWIFLWAILRSEFCPASEVLISQLHEGERSVHEG